MNLNKYIVVFFLSLSCNSCTNPVSKQNIEHISIKEQFASIPQRDREILHDFFKQLIVSNPFAYTLFGDKPCSIADYRHEICSFTSHEAFTECIYEKGWQCWSRYCHLFPSNNFILKKISYEEHPNSATILLINKLATLNILKRNKNFFCERWQCNLPEQELFEKMVENGLFLQKDQAALGLLLGFGKRNALAFERSDELCCQIARQMLPPFKQELKGIDSLSVRIVNAIIKQKSDLQPECSDETSKFIEELNVLRSNSESFELSGVDNTDIEAFTTPAFVALKNDPETISLQQKYLATTTKIVFAYRGKSFLEVTLARWTGIDRSELIICDGAQ